MFNISNKKLLEINNLHIVLREKNIEKSLVENINIKSYRGKITCIVGESGSGKSITIKSILNLLKEPLHRKEGQIFFKNKNINNLNKYELQDITKNHFSIIFQNPQSSLNPTMKVGEQLFECIYEKGFNSKETYRNICLQALDDVGIKDSKLVYNKYPFQLSGGMCQRIMIAMALLKKPDILIADEPTTALDMVTQAEILKQLYSMKTNYNTSILFITHDLKVVAEIADYIYVMKEGEIVEENDVYSIFEIPKHPYTKKLINSMY